MCTEKLNKPWSRTGTENMLPVDGGGQGDEMTVAEGKFPKADRRGGSGMMSGTGREFEQQPTS